MCKEADQTLMRRQMLDIQQFLNTLLFLCVTFKSTCIYYLMTNYKVVNVRKLFVMNKRCRRITNETEKEYTALKQNQVRALLICHLQILGEKKPNKTKQKNNQTQPKYSKIYHRFIFGKTIMQFHSGGFSDNCEDQFKP